MASSSTFHGGIIGHGTQARPETPVKRSETREFLSDVWMTLRHEFTHAKGTEEIDLFRKHMNAMAITYFAIIVLCMIISIPVLAYMINYNWQM